MVRVREVRTLCDKGDNLDAERIYIALPDGRYPVDLCPKHIKELREKWIPDTAEGVKRKGRVTSVEAVVQKRTRRKAAPPPATFISGE